jgi:hypothetical protein
MTGLHRKFALLAVIATLALGAVPAVAGVNGTVATDRVVRTGECVDGPSKWRLAAVKIDSGIRVRFRIDTGVADQKWQVFMSNGESRLFAGTLVSNSLGVVRIARRAADLAGVVPVKATGVKEATGESCSGGLRI